MRDELGVIFLDKQFRTASNPTKSLRSLCYTGVRLAARVRPALFAVYCYLPFASGAHMSTEILMPQLGESVVEGTVSRWLIAEGQPVQQDQPLLQITTDKVDTELPAPASGILLKILVPEGQTVAKGTVLGVIGDQGSGSGIRRIRDQESERVDTPTLGFISPVVGRLADELRRRSRPRSAAPARAAASRRRMCWPTRPRPCHTSRLPAPMPLPVTESLVPGHPSAEAPDPRQQDRSRSLRCARPSPGTWC